MRKLVTAFGRFIALFVTLAMLTSSVAMAAYVCPTNPPVEAPAAMVISPDAERMDDDMPAHCAERRAGDKQALEQSSAAPALALPAIVSVRLLAPATSPMRQAANWRDDAPRFPAHAPPFLRTQRLRI